MKPEKIERIRERAAGLLKRAHIAVTPQERAGMEVAEFGLGDVERLGLEIIVYENNDRYCAKELVMFPWQICPEHRHPGREPDACREAGDFPLPLRRGVSLYPRRTGRQTESESCPESTPGILPSGKRSCSGRAASTPCRPIPCTGSRPGAKAPSSRSSRPRAPMKTTSSPTRPSAAFPEPAQMTENQFSIVAVLSDRTSRTVVTIL